MNIIKFISDKRLIFCLVIILFSLLIYSIIKNIKEVKAIKYMGINEYGDSAIFYKLRIWCMPEIKNQIRRESLRLIKLKLDKNKISIPYTQFDIHSK